MMIYEKGRCIHYNGTINKKCGAGIVYTAVTKAGDGIVFDRMPCFSQNGIAGLCTACQYPSEKEIKDSDRELGEHIQKMTAVRRAIVADIKAKNAANRSFSSMIDCPLCDGKVSYSYAGSYNRHIHARCSTAGCVNWIE